eukprot:scaffold664_cov260-Pinguiococcus_pyrenoidosus.AAC.37
MVVTTLTTLTTAKAFGLIFSPRKRVSSKMSNACCADSRTPLIPHCGLVNFFKASGRGCRRRAEEWKVRGEEGEEGRAFT